MISWIRKLMDVAGLADAAQQRLEHDGSSATRAVDAHPGRRFEQLTRRVHTVGAGQDEVVHADVWAEDPDVLALLPCIQDRGERRRHHLSLAVEECLYRVDVGIEHHDGLLDADCQPEVASVVADAVDQRDL